MSLIDLNSIPMLLQTALSSFHPFWHLYNFKNPPIKKSTSFVPDELASAAEELKSTKEIASQVPNYESFETTGTIQFAGGGGLITLEFDDEKLEKIERLWDNPYDDMANADESIKAGGFAEAELALGYAVLPGVGMEVEGSYNHETTHRMSKESETSKTTSISVQLGDPGECKLTIYLIFLCVLSSISSLHVGILADGGDEFTVE